MIGPKKLNTIREDIQRAFADSGDDPLRWLEERMSAPTGKHAAAGSEVLESLNRFLQEPKPPKRRKPRTRSRK